MRSARSARGAYGGLTALMVAGAALFSGCMTGSPAPVSDRAVPSKPSAAAVSKPGEPVIVESKSDAAVVVKPLAPLTAPDGPSHTVRQGDTLFSIAKANGLTARDLGAWNNVDDRANISVGQVLRLTPPGGVAVMPVKPSAGVEARPLGNSSTSSAAEGAPPAADGSTKTQPLGQRVPYSEQAYAQMTKTPLPPKPDAKAEIKPDAKAEKTEKAETKTDVKAEPKPDKAVAAGEVNWGWPTQGKVVRNFNEGSNKGIAIAGKRGQPVIASAAGRVIFSGTGIRGLGQLVVIRHNLNYLSVYAHNDKLLVKQGQTVTKGQSIAEMGNSDTDQVKLHFEIRRQGKPVDPMRLLPDM